MLSMRTMPTAKSIRSDERLQRDREALEQRQLFRCLPRLHAALAVLVDAFIIGTILAVTGKTLLAVALTPGVLRKGENLALRWTDFEWSGNFPLSVNIAHTLVQVKGEGFQIRDVKTAKSRHTIKLPRFVAEALLRRQLIQEQERLDAGKDWNEQGLVFTNRWGGPVIPERINELLDEALAKIEVPHVRVHDLRHTAATLLLAKGVPMKMVSEILGHHRDHNGRIRSRRSEDARRSRLRPRRTLCRGKTECCTFCCTHQSKVNSMTELSS